MAFKDGDIVKVHYTAFQDNEVVETTKEEVAVKEGIFDEKRKYQAAIAVIGERNFFEKVDNELKNMSVGEKKRIKLEPKEAFGERNDELVRVVALKEFKKRNITPFPGLVVDLNGLKGRVQSVSGGRVRVDFNHPLAGKEIEFELEVIEKIEGDENKANALVEKFFSFARDDIKFEFKENALIVEAPAHKLVGVEGLKRAFAKAALKSTKAKEVKFVESFTEELLKETEPKEEGEQEESEEQK